MDETPQINTPKPKTHRRHTSITTIADNVNSDDSASTSSKGSNSTTSSVVSIRVRPKTPDLPPPGSETIMLDNNSNEIQKKPENRTYNKEVPQSKIHYYKPHTPVDSKPRPLTHSYKYFSGPPPRYRDYKYRDYKAKNTDIPKYKEHKYREYNTYREYKLTPWNTFWLGGYKENVPKVVPKKPKPVGRPKKPPKKIGILSAHSMFYPYSEFKYKPYETVKEYKYRDYSGYKEYKGYREYKGRQMPLSTHYDFIGIWRPFGSKGPIPWRKSKTFNPPFRYVYPPVDGEKFFDPPARYISQSSTTEKVQETPEDEDLSRVYDPPQRKIQPHVDTVNVSEATIITEDEKIFDPPEKRVVVMSTEEPVYTEETKMFEPPQRVIVLSIAAAEVAPIESTPLVTAPQLEYDEEYRIHDPPQRSIVEPREYAEESKDLDQPSRQLTPPKEYVEETKVSDPPQNTVTPPREYVEESRDHDPLSKTIIAPKEYIEEEKTVDLQEKQLKPPTVIAEPAAEEIVPEMIQPQIFALPINIPPEAASNYEPEVKVLDVEERQILPPPTENEDLLLYKEETKIYDPKEKLVNVPSEELNDVPAYTEEEKTLEPPERQLRPPDKNNVETETNDPDASVHTFPTQPEVVPDTAEKGSQEKQEPSEEYIEEIKVFSPQQQCMAEPIGVDREPISNQVIEKEESEPIKEDNSFQESSEAYEPETRTFSPRTAQKIPLPVAPIPKTKAEIVPQMPAQHSEPVLKSELPATASENTMSPEYHTEESRIFSPVSAQIEPPNATTTSVQEAAIVPQAIEPVVRGELTAPDASLVEVPSSSEEYTEESRGFSPVSAYKSPPPATPKPVRRAQIVPQQVAETSMPRVTSEPAAAASGCPPEPPRQTHSPHDVKEAWQPQPQEDPAPKPPTVAETVSKVDHERSASQPASESSVINPRLPNTREPSPEIMTPPALKSPTPSTPVVPAEKSISEPTPIFQSSPAHTADTVTQPKTLDSPELAASTKPPSSTKPESPGNQDPPKSATPLAEEGAEQPGIPASPQLPIAPNSGDFTAPDTEADVGAKSASPNPNVRTNPTPVKNYPIPMTMDVSMRAEQGAPLDDSPVHPSLTAPKVPYLPNETVQAENPTPQSAGKSQEVLEENAGSPKPTPEARDTKRPVLQPLRPASPVASVAKPVASASSGFPTKRPDFPYTKVSPRVQVLEEREGKPVMSVGGDEEATTTNNTTPLMVSPRGQPGASLGSIQRTMRLLGK